MEDLQKLAPNLRIIRILEILAKQSVPMTPTELNRELGLPKQSLHRLCTLLVTEGYLEKSGRALIPAPRAMNLASGLARISATSIACHQILNRVSSEFSETVNLVRPEKKGMNYIDRVETNWPFRILLPVGTHVPFHCTASGKTFLANLPNARRRAFLRTLSLDSLTAYTLTESDRLEDELQTVKTQGFATDNEEFHEGMVAIAAPIFNAHGDYFGAVAVHGPKNRYSLESAIARIGTLKQAARDIEHILFSPDA